MKKYEAYKNSGVEWIGEIPEGWSLSKLKFETDMVLGKMLEDKEPQNDKGSYTLEPYLKSRNIGMLEVFNDIEQLDRMWFNDKEKTQYELKDGDLVMNEGGDIGKVSLWKDPGFKCYIQNSVHKLTPHRDVLDSTYLQYLVSIITTKGYFNTVVSSISIAHLTKEKLAETPILLPSLSEQQAIASYLDHKVGQIDASVSAINTQIDDLKAYRQSIISEAVTKGLNSNVPMKNSGIEWIGEIPDNWECVKVKHILHQSKDGIKIGPFGSSLTGKVDTKGDFKVYGQWNIVGKDFTAGRNYVGKDTYESLDSYVIVAGDILVSMMGTVGKCAIIPKGILPGIMDSHVVKVRLDTSKMIPSYFEYVYDKDNSNVIFSQIQKYRRGSIMDGLNSTLIKEFTLPSPPLSEQQAIASYLDSKTSKIDATIAFLESQRDDLNALKQSVISEAVTGKIDVREWKKD